jgi:hypothetical protein
VKDGDMLYQEYMKRTHHIGRIFSLVAIAMFLGAPFVIGQYFGVGPDLVAALHAGVSVGIIYLVCAFAEYAVYVPMLGAGGSYLAFITGNLINMKIPCAMHARDIVGVKSGTPESEIVGTLSIAASAVTTILVLALGVLLITPLRPVLESPAVAPAFESVVPALFGSMACKYYMQNIGVSAITFAVMALLFILVPSLAGSISIMVIPSALIAMLVLFVMTKMKKGSAKE